MAEHVHKSYSCDRCKADLGAERPKHNQSCSVSASFNWREGPGPSFEWRDLCEHCRETIFAWFMPDYHDPARGGFAGTATAYFKDLVERSVSDGSAMKTMARAARCIDVMSTQPLPEKHDAGVR